MGNNDNKNPRKGRWEGFGFGGSGGGGEGGGGSSRWRFSIIYIIGAVLVLILLRGFASSGTTRSSINAFYTAFNTHDLKSVEIANDSVSWTTKEDKAFKATLPPNFNSTTLIQDLAAQNISVKGVVPNPWAGLVFQLILWFVLLGGIYYFLIRRMTMGGAGALNLGKNRVKIYDRKEMKTTFADVAGVDEAVDELREIVDFLKTPKKYQRLGGRIPKGVLLLGPPGCGKTLLARAVAGEAAVPFFFMSGSEFVEMFVGLGAARVRELFQQAKEKAPCLVFLDELDTIGKSRAGAMGGSFGTHDEREQTLNQLLVEMDGFDASKGVIIMAATNRADVLDPALVRPGRFDRQVVVDRPDLRGREAILKIHARGVALDRSVDLRILASRTPGFTGADLANVVNEAALLAARREKDGVSEEELEEAIDRTVAGLERRSRVLSDKEKARVAAHEMGHALAALRSKNIDPVHRVTIIPRGAAALGITMVRPLEDRYTITEPELRDRLVFAMGGRVAEQLMFGEISTGAQNDLQQATEIARAMVSEFGMSPKLGPVSFGRDGFRNADGRPFFQGDRPEIANETARMVDEEVARFLNEAYEQAYDILERDRDLLARLSDVLIEREVIEGSELRRYVEGKEPIPTREELQRQARAKQTDNGGQQKDQIATGPNLGLVPPGFPSPMPVPDVPSRPD